MIGNFYTFNNYTLYFEFLLRLVLSAILAGFIGYEREFRSKDAGLRTHILVGVGSAVIMIVSQYGFFEIIQNDIRVDPSRIAAQVVSGIGFLGVGVIFKEHGSIKGLSTAAGLWGVAAIGLSVGSGLYTLAITFTIFMIIIFEVLNRLSKNFYTIHIEIQFKSKTLDYFEIKNYLSDEKHFILASRIQKDDSYNTFNFKIKIRNENDLYKIIDKINKNTSLSLDFFEIL
ncbi:MAG: MgtC/SapB family protein [Sarcina sp.]